MRYKFPEVKGCEFYLAGGAVRDHLLNKEPKDLDFVVMTKLTFDQLCEEILKTELAQVFMRKPEFLTLRCKIGKEVFDIAYPRSEQGFSDHRRPDKVTRVATLKEDAARRDFTINAMYMDKEGKILDFYGGQKDLRARKIRCVGDPYQRFQEDYLRILRAIRFKIQLTFSIEDKTVVAINQLADELRKISMDRIKDELNKCLTMNPEETFLWIRYNGILEVLKEKGLRFKLTCAKR